MHILLVDDNTLQREMIGSWLTSGGHTFDASATQAAFLERLTQTRGDLLLIDWSLPDGSGAEILKWVRTNMGWEIPAMVLTANEDEETVVEALRAGADDYVAKKVKPSELNARIAAVARRVKPIALTVTRLDVYEADTVQQRLSVNQENIALTQKEFDLATYLLQNPDKLLSRDHLLNAIWGLNTDVDTRTVDTHVSRLRKKLMLDGTHGWRLAPIYGYGYRLQRADP
jgi:two-component system, OmpR family, response regulator RegX3